MPQTSHGAHGRCGRKTPAVRRAFRARDDTGSASVSALAVALSVLLFALLGVTLAAALHARHRAQSAADFAALTAASHALEGVGEACAQASTIATANGATVTGCALEGMNATVSVSVTPAFAPTAALGGSAVATARAGPVAPVEVVDGLAGVEGMGGGGRAASNPGSLTRSLPPRGALSTTARRRTTRSHREILANSQPLPPIALATATGISPGTKSPAPIHARVFASWIRGPNTCLRKTRHQFAVAARVCAIAPR